jgi:hypothetical protein
MVGLVVALLILKSAIELLIGILRSRGDEEIDLTRYRFGPAERYEGFRSRQFRAWLLFTIGKNEPIDREAMVEELVRTLDFRQIPTLRELGFTKARFYHEESINKSLNAVIREGLVADEARLRLTRAGRRAVQRLLGRIT